VIPSARWTRWAVITVTLGLLTGFYGTGPAADALFHLDNVDTAVHFSDLQDAIAIAAFGVFAAGVSLTTYFTVRFARRSSVMASTLGVTVFNWKTITVPWLDIADVTLTPVTRFGRRGWVPGIVLKDGGVVPVAFSAFLPSRRRAGGIPPQMPASGKAFEVSALIRSGLDAHAKAPGQPAPQADPGNDPLALPPASGHPWTSGRLAISREWVAFKDVSGKVPWNVIPYAAVTAVSPAPGRGITIREPNGLHVVIGADVLAVPEASALLAEGLDSNSDVASAARPLLRPYLEASQVKRDSLVAAMHKVGRHGTTQTFHLQRRLLVACGIGLLVFAACCFGVALEAPLSGWNPNVSDKPGVAELIAIGIAFTWFGIRLCRVGVQVSGRNLTIRNYFRTRTVDVGDIRAITVQPKQSGESGSVWTPRVDLTDGTSIWISSFECGPAFRPPRLDRVAVVDELRKQLGVEATDST
jgi:hypothetical protein